MRAGEFCGLRVEDLDLEQRQVSVRQSAWHGRLQTVKSQKGNRHFALSPELAEHLATYLASWRENEKRLLFATRNGTPWDPNLLIKRHLHPLLTTLGIPRCGMHAFRHGNGSLMDRLNVPVKVRQDRLGHSDPKMTLNVYTHLASADDQKLAAQLGPLLAPGNKPERVM
jgi:integrase